MRVLLAVSALLAVAQGFTPSHSAAAFLRNNIVKGETSSQLYEIIKADEADFKFDRGSGGVRLANESAIKLAGSVKHGPGKATAEVNTFLRYKKVTELDESTVQSAMSKSGASIITTGSGQENFKDPGATTTKEVTLAPDQAVRDALMGAAAVDKASNIVINFLGGDDLIADQVTKAISTLVLDMSPPTKAKITFNSMCHTSFPLERATVTVVSTSGDEAEEGVNGAEKNISNGEVYFCNGKWYTVVEDDINTAVA